MNVLVTGATGFVGSHVVDQLLERGHHVSYIARKTSNLRWLHQKAAHQVNGSLFNLDSLKSAVSSADMVIHVAGLTAAKNEAEFMRGNRDATQNLIDAVRAYRPGLERFVHISSLAVCGPASSEYEPVTEDAPFRPITAYGRTKRAAEEIILSAPDVPSTIIRPPAVYGPRDEAILTFFQTINKGISTLIGFSEKRISLVHVRDLARGIVEAAFSPNAKGQTYFIGSDDSYTWPEIANLTGAIMGKRKLITMRIPHSVVLGIAGTVGVLGKLIGKPPVLDYEKGIDLIQPYWICSSKKAHEHFGYKQLVSLQDGIQETVEWYRENEWL